MIGTEPVWQLNMWSRKEQIFGRLHEVSIMTIIQFSARIMEENDHKEWPVFTSCLCDKLLLYFVWAFYTRVGGRGHDVSIRPTSCYFTLSQLLTQGEGDDVYQSDQPAGWSRWQALVRSYSVTASHVDNRSLIDDDQIMCNAQCVHCTVFFPLDRAR